MIQLHPWVELNPIQHVAQLEKEASFWNRLSTISYVAITAITLTVLASSFVLSGAPSIAISLSLGALILSTPCFAWGASHCQIKLKDLEQQLSLARPVAEVFQQIKDWESPQILAFLEQHHIAAPPSVELSRLIPLIARFEASSNVAISLKERSEQMLKKASQISDRDLRLSERVIAWHILEKMAIPAMLEAAFTLQILKNPSLQGTVSDYFQLTQKSFEERQFDRLYGPDDHYAQFLKENRPPLSLAYLMNCPLDEILKL